jgi:hypothetical protein
MPARSPRRTNMDDATVVPFVRSLTALRPLPAFLETTNILPSPALNCSHDNTEFVTPTDFGIEAFCVMPASVKGDPDALSFWFARQWSKSLLLHKEAKKVDQAHERICAVTFYEFLRQLASKSPSHARLLSRVWEELRQLNDRRVHCRYVLSLPFCQAALFSHILWCCSASRQALTL